MDRFDWKISELDGKVVEEGQATSLYYALDDVQRFASRIGRDNIIVSISPASEPQIETRTRPRLAFVDQAIDESERKAVNW